MSSYLLAHMRGLGRRQLWTGYLKCHISPYVWSLIVMLADMSGIGPSY
jgi:hypothetical protein